MRCLFNNTSKRHKPITKVKTMFDKEGQFKGKVIEVMMAKSKFNPDDPNAFDICLRIEHEGKSDWWRGEISPHYGKGNVSDKTQAQLTLKSLQNAGFQGSDLSQVEKQMTGKEIDFTVESREYNGKAYYDIKYIGSNFGPVRLDPASMQARLAAANAALNGGAVPAPAPAAAPAAQTPPPAAAPAQTPPQEQQPAAGSAPAPAWPTA
jgi:hypothetical protein